MRLHHLFVCCLSVTYAPISSAIDHEQEVIKHCNNVSNYAQQGNTAYANKEYQKALKAFENQAAWLGFCSLNEDITGKVISKSQISTAYNNVGLTYAKLDQPRWAKAWYSIMPNESKSQFNLKALGNIKSTTDKTGKYVKYIGQGQWDTINVAIKGQFYVIEYFGLRMGINSMLYGPNIGQFNTTMSKNAQTTRFHDSDYGCVIDLKFNQGNSINVKQNQVDCGFGMGVYAEGNYVKVENSLN